MNHNFLCLPQDCHDFRELKFKKKRNKILTKLNNNESINLNMVRYLLSIVRAGHSISGAIKLSKVGPRACYADIYVFEIVSGNLATLQETAS